MIKVARLLMLSCVLLLPSCVGLVVGSTVDATVAVAKIPFRVAGAAVDVIIPDEEKDRKSNDGIPRREATDPDSGEGENAP